MKRDGLPLHGGQLQHIADYFDIPASSLRDFSANINPDGPPIRALTVLRQALDEASVLMEYPDLDEPVLRAAISSYAGVETECIAVANGFVPLFDAALRATSVRKCLVPVPAFIEYRRSLENASVEVSTIVLDPAANFQYEIGALLDGAHDAILLANPQNPSGILHDRETILDLTVRAAKRDILILLDEAFIDYCGGASLAEYVEHHPNLIVFRSLTKFFGMPGLRVAYSISSPRTALRLQNKVAPWSVTTLASRAAAAAVHDKEYASRAKALNHRRRNQLDRELTQLSFQTTPSSANFILFRLPANIDPASFWRRMIEEHRIVLRQCGAYESLTRDYFRVAVRGDSDNHYLVEALRKALKFYEAEAEVLPDEDHRKR